MSKMLHFWVPDYLPKKVRNLTSNWRVIFSTIASWFPPEIARHTESNFVPSGDPNLTFRIGQDFLIRKIKFNILMIVKFDLSHNFVSNSSIRMMSSSIPIIHTFVSSPVSSARKFPFSSRTTAVLRFDNFFSLI